MFVKSSQPTQNALRMSQYVAPIRLTGNLNMACAVLPNGNSNVAIPDDATDKIIFPFDLSAATIAFHRYVFPVHPLPYTKIHSL